MDLWKEKKERGKCLILLWYASRITRYPTKTDDLSCQQWLVDAWKDSPRQVNNKLPSSRKFIRPNVFIRTRSFLEIKTKKFKLQPQYKKNKFYPKNYGWKQNLVWDQSIIVPLFSDEFRRWFKKDPNVNIRQSILYLKIFQLCIISGWLTKLQMIKFGKQYNKLDLQKLQDPRLCTSYFIIDAGT